LTVHYLDLVLPGSERLHHDFQTVERRCLVWSRPDQPVGLAFNRIKDAIHRGFADRLHFVRFEDLGGV